MKILSVNFGHDASLALLDDGELRGFIELERYTRIKHTLGVLSSDIESFLSSLKLSLSDIDLAAVSATQFWGAHHSSDIKVEFGYGQGHRAWVSPSEAWNADRFTQALVPAVGIYAPHLTARGIKDSSPFMERVKFDFPFYHGMPPTAALLDAVVDHNVRLIEAACNVDEHYRKLLENFLTPCVLNVKGTEIPAFFVSHHYAHACYGHYYAASTDSLIVSHDGGLPGLAFNSGGIYGGFGDKVIPLISHKLALGYIYDQAGLLAGFNEGDGPGKLMGLAAYGFPSDGCAAMLAEVLALSVPNMHCDPQILSRYIQKLETLSRADANIRAKAVEPFEFTFHDRNFSIALAANTQTLVEEAFVKALSPYLNKMLSRVGSAKSVGVVGGFALNCPANTRLQMALGTTITNPLPGAIDTGLSIGAAAAVASFTGGALKRRVEALGSGAAFCSTALVSKDEKDARFKTLSLTQPLHEFMAAELAAGKIICLFRGSSEIGPRALGHRSILARASSADIRDYINRRKGRENWRPLAPICREEDFSRYFSGNPRTCRFMLFTYPVTTDAISGVTHADGTARVQTVNEGDRLLYDVLAALPAYAEPAVIINTSFNTAGEPIVETPQHARDSFCKLGFDYLIIEETVFVLSGARIGEERPQLLERI